MRQKLQKKGVTQEEVADTISWLQEKKLLNDVVFAQRKAESIYRTKLVGPRYIEIKLKVAGISDTIINETIDTLAEDTQWRERAQQAIEQWKKSHPKHAADRIRQMRFLQSKGFENFSPSYEGE